MQPIRSSVDIEAPASLVWAILTDFASYPRWNPFIRTALGRPGQGKGLAITVQSHGAQPLSTRCALTCVREPRELRWRRKRIAPLLFASEHRFRIEPLPAGGVRFHQSEHIEGLLAPLLGRGRLRAIEQDFHAMNHALKARAERVQSGEGATGATVPSAAAGAASTGGMRGPR